MWFDTCLVALLFQNIDFFNVGFSRLGIITNLINKSNNNNNYQNKIQDSYKFIPGGSSCGFGLCEIMKNKRKKQVALF